MPKLYPRGGGPHDQDPQLMRDFRAILKIKGQCDELEDARDKVHEQMDNAGITGTGASKSGGGGLGLEEALESFMEEEGY